nr:MAG TPA: hypothetical protein [Caudoviricetes sp.]
MKILKHNIFYCKIVKNIKYIMSNKMFVFFGKMELAMK